MTNEKGPNVFKIEELRNGEWSSVNVCLPNRFELRGQAERAANWLSQAAFPQGGAADAYRVALLGD